MSARPQPGTFRRQDGQILTAPGPHRQPHPQWRWNIRADDEWAGYNVRAAWREAVPVSIAVSGDAYARYHAESRMLLIARYGVIQTVLHIVEDCSGERRDRVLSQVGDRR